MAESWTIKGEYLETCNCELLCPCLLGPRNAQGGPTAQPTEGHCDVPMVFHIEAGQFGDVDLDGTHAALAIYTPGPMGEWNWTVAPYVDASASAEQQKALESIFLGKAGGPPEVVAAAVSTWLPLRVVEMDFGQNGRERWAKIPDVLDVVVEGIEGQDGPDTVTWLDNVRHFVSTRLATAKATRGTYRDHGLDWDNTGRNAHYAAFEWSGP